MSHQINYFSTNIPSFNVWQHAHYNIEFLSKEFISNIFELYYQFVHGCLDYYSQSNLRFKES